MFSCKVVINGVTYIRSRDAARTVSLGIWFVDLTSLKNFVAEQERQKELLRAGFAQMRREEQRLAGHPSAALA